MTEYHSLGSAIHDIFGSGISVTERTAVSGGDINRAYRLTLSDGRNVFMKANSADNIDFFRCEVSGLKAIKDTDTIDTPTVLGLGIDGVRSFLLLSNIESAVKNKDFYEDFGHRLAAMHNAPAEGIVPGGKFGFFEDNFIGAGPQCNTPCDSFIDFFRDYRLKPQFERAGSYFSIGEKKAIDRFLSHLGDYLKEPDHPSLLHGDLWGGNYMVGSNGAVCLIDPAVYVGHAEADIAMTELFGGFPAAFYSAYYEVNGLDRDYSVRRDIYNLYHLLNHLNLFGIGYLSSVKGILRHFT